MFKKILLIICLVTSLFGAQSAGLNGIVLTGDTVENNNFTYPKQIWTMYFPNDPSEAGKVLAYVSYKKLGQHTPSIEITDATSGKYIDKCTFDPMNVTKLPWTYTITCSWGGRMGDGGLNFTVYNQLSGKKENIGEMYIPAKKN